MVFFPEPIQLTMLNGQEQKPLPAKKAMKTPIANISQLFRLSRTATLAEAEAETAAVVVAAKLMSLNAMPTYGISLRPRRQHWQNGKQTDNEARAAFASSGNSLSRSRSRNRYRSKRRIQKLTFC